MHSVSSLTIRSHLKLTIVRRGVVEFCTWLCAKLTWAKKWHCHLREKTSLLPPTFCWLIDLNPGIFS